MMTAVRHASVQASGSESWTIRVWMLGSESPVVIEVDGPVELAALGFSPAGMPAVGADGRPVRYALTRRAAERVVASIGE